MRRPRAWTLLPPAAVCALLTVWIVLAAANAQAASVSLLIYGLANLIVYTDALDFLLRLHVRRRHTATAGATEDNRNVSIDLVAALPGGVRRLVPIRPYAIIASVFNLADQLDEFVAAFGPYRERVWLISDGSTDSTVTRLTQQGWRCFDDGVNRRKPGALRVLLERLPPHIETVMVIDPDIRLRGRSEGSRADLEQVIGDFQQSGAAAVCPRIMIEPDGFLARFQAFEYALAFRVGRESLADYSITSGAVSIYRRDALWRALHEHSLSVYAEDLENAVILLSHGERIYYDGRLVASTEGPGTVARWFSQRVGWYHGLLKVYTERVRSIWRISRRTPFAGYHFIVYMGGLSIVLHLVKIVSALLLLVSLVGGFDNLFLAHLLPRSTLTSPAYFIGAVGSYLALGVMALFTVVPRSERAYIAPIVPLYLFYALTHLIPMTVGFGNFIALQLWGRRLYRDHYEGAVGGAAPGAPELLVRRPWS
ncbi:MAG TPA: glycosyltransferase family 2 protein [Steroidobacteraceae bacterium]|jgi:cellulose synthase/poly-beta-1,6-N-acetylglucosamine synthase-like glycosyltransferase|nr:glycosyltransferase family 2 protein [Steroidobacteraceae bacterium]